MIPGVIISKGLAGLRVSPLRSVSMSYTYIHQCQQLAILPYGTMAISPLHKIAIVPYHHVESAS